MFSDTFSSIKYSCITTTFFLPLLIIFPLFISSKVRANNYYLFGIQVALFLFNMPAMPQLVFSSSLFCFVFKQESICIIQVLGMFEFCYCT